MKRILKILFFVLTINELKSEKLSFYAPIDARTEAMGNTGMIFGKEHGSLFYAPTSVFSTEGFISFEIPGMNLAFNSEIYGLIKALYDVKEFNNLVKNLANELDKKDTNELKNSLSSSFNIRSYLRISTFILGFYSNINIPELYIDFKKGLSSDIGGSVGGNLFIPLSYSFNFYNDFYLGMGAKLFLTPNNRNSFLGRFESKINLNYDEIDFILKGSAFNGVSFDSSFMYNSSFGKFALSLNNIISYLSCSYFELDSYKSVDGTSAVKTFSTNVKLAYGKEIDLPFPLTKVRLAAELDNIFMQDLYFLGENDYNLARKINLGFEIPFSILNILKLDIRGGVSNLFPTIGFGINVLNIFQLDYSFSKKLNRKSISDGGVYLNSFSIVLGFF